MSLREAPRRSNLWEALGFKDIPHHPRPFAALKGYMPAIDTSHTISNKKESALVIFLTPYLPGRCVKFAESLRLYQAIVSET